MRGRSSLEGKREVEGLERVDKKRGELDLLREREGLSMIK